MPAGNGVNCLSEDNKNVLNKFYDVYVLNVQDI